MTTTTSTSRRSSSSTRSSTGRTTTVHVRCSTRVDGDFHRLRVPLVQLERRRRRLVDLPWTMLDEHHGTGVVRVGQPGQHDGAAGDIAITSVTGAVLGCWVGDCAPLVLIGADRELGVVHAGWRGLAAGVIDAAFAAFSEPVEAAWLGPSIGPCCYEFGGDDLEAVAVGVHADPATVRGATIAGELALDVAAAVAAACGAHGVTVERLAGCTGCTYDGFSHRARGDIERHVVAAWREDHE